MLMSSPCDGFRLAYERYGAGGQSLILLHGWPGDHTDFRHVVPLLGEDCDIVVPDLRGFGHSDKQRVDPFRGYGATAQARSIAALIDELDLRRPVVGGYDVGSRVAQTVAKENPGLATAPNEQPPAPDHRISTPASVLWPEHDPLFPREWSDRLGEFFTDAQLHTVDGAGHFTPVECPDEFAELITRAVTTA
jgi:pimeloyl-ACP methyl ester carboxylesterase